MDLGEAAGADRVGHPLGSAGGEEPAVQVGGEAPDVQHEVVVEDDGTFPAERAEPGELHSRSS
jgi:hypothetical protein